ncbi:MAG: DUF523 domain-containing protein [Anaerolineae bacterium]|nr:DUF523 domain-containing protein [Anaerolineae bacterium]
MFDDARSKSLIFVAHCILNQNAISDGTADFPGHVNDILSLLNASDVGIVQMPCPELHCLGLDRGNVHGSASPVVRENTRIRRMLSRDASALKIERLVQHVMVQILEYRKHGFEIVGMVGINRSPSCGVDTTSKEDQEMSGQGVFMEALRAELDRHNIQIEMVGIKAFEAEKALIAVKRLLGITQ